MTRRNFFRSALACFGAMVLAPVRAVEPETVDLWEMYLPGKQPYHVLEFPSATATGGSMIVRIKADTLRELNETYNRILAARPPV